MQTLGQAFDLAAKEASKPKPKKAGKAAVAHEAAAAIYDSAAAIDPSIADAFAIPEEVDEMIYDVAQVCTPSNVHLCYILYLISYIFLDASEGFFWFFSATKRFRRINKSTHTVLQQYLRALMSVNLKQK